MGAIPVIFGLGNPGGQYAYNRHNAGFMFVDFLASFDSESTPFDEHPLYWIKKIQNPLPAILVKPRTFMNCSGEAVASLCADLSLSSDQIMIVYDDLALPLGRMKMKPSGSSGGQKGIGNIMERCGTDKIPRLRLGIGPRPENLSTVDFVLSDFLPEEYQIFKKLMGSARESLVCWADHGISIAMSQCNGFKLIDPDLEEKREE